MPHWAEGRHVGIFPDVPGKFKPEHSIIITTEELGAIVHVVVSEIFKRVKDENKHSESGGHALSVPRG